MVRIGILQFAIVILPLDISVGLRSGLRVAEVDEEPLSMSVVVLNILEII